MPGEISIAQVVLMGLITVFVGLICLIIIIKLMGTIIALLKQQSASPEKAEALYEYMIRECKKSVPEVQTGIFGADMEVSLVNDGPFTVILDSDQL